MTHLRVSVLAALTFALLAPVSVSAQTPDVPAPLTEWVPWVLHGQEAAACARADGAPLCAWPGRLVLRLDDAGGSFALDVVADAPLDLPLPGDTTRWPRDLRNGTSAAPLGRSGGRPAVHLEAGSHRITGSFSWTRLPESLAVPPAIGLVDLTVRGAPVPNPRRDKDGSLWLQGGAAEQAEEDRLSLEVHRRIDDGVPVEITTRLRLRVSGRSREVSLGAPLMPDTAATALTSSLPARLDGDGTLQVQLRPGDWEISLGARSTGPVVELSPPVAAAPWPDEEIWVFRASPSVRSVRVDGAPGVDPARTSLPEGWRNLPAWRVARGTAVTLVELRRGEAQPPPDRLDVARQMWLSLDGEQLSVRDRVTGALFEGGRLELVAPGTLGRASISGQDQLVTSSGGPGGVEVRSASLNLDAASTIPAAGELPAVGWNRDAQSLRATLEVPPGWMLITATGVDDAGGSWLEAWTLMDLFLVLLIALAIGKLTAPQWGVLALALLMLGWQEDGMPQATWLVLLAALGLLRVIPPGVVSKLMNLVRWAVIVVLATQVTVFCWSASRAALFPQLDHYASAPLDGYSYTQQDSVNQMMDFGVVGGANAPAALPMEMDALAEEEPMDQVQQSAGKGEFKSVSRSSYGGGQDKDWAPKKRAARLDPQAVVQTGPGLPQWSWRSYPLRWNGPVSADHTVRLYLTGPIANGVLGLLRVAGIVILLLLLGDPRSSKTVPADPPKPSEPAAAAVAAALFLLLPFGLALGPSPASAQALPDKALLDQLGARLTARPACEPDCVQVASMTVGAGSEGLRIEAQVHAAALAPWKLPGPDSAWVPTRIQLDGSDVVALHRDAAGFLSLRVPKGVHTVVLTGRARDEVGLQFPVIPRVLTFETDSWTIAGFRADAPPPGSVQLSRSRPLDDDAGGTAEENAELPPWLQVHRELDLGVPWLVHNELRRMGGGTRAVLARVPLLAGESVTTPGIPVEGAVAVVALEPGETVRAWDSTLTEAPTLALTAPADQPWTEVWALDCSPIWSCSAAGLAPTRHLAEGRWLPRWQPWPGETLTLTLTRPSPAPGVTTTLDSATLSLTSGRRLMEAVLNYSLRSSQGGEHAVTLPSGATLRSFKLDGRDHPAQPDGDRLLFAVDPGAHSVEASWSQPASGGVFAKAPAVDVGEGASNVQIEWQMPDHRWVLWAWGPRWGPVVTVWQYLLVLILAAVLLGRLAPTPLKTADWFLMGLGLTQIPPGLTVVVVLWLVALSLRGKRTFDRWWLHLWVQLALIGMTFAALGVLYGAVYEGLIADPDLGVRGAGSRGGLLRWFVDQSDSTLPQPGVFWLPVWCWRIAMLLWALWLSSRLLQWLRWGWDQLSHGGLWTLPPWWPFGKKDAAPATEPATE